MFQRIILTTIITTALNVYTWSAQPLDGGKIDQLTGLKGKLNEKEGVYKVSQPRTDIKVTVDGREGVVESKDPRQ